MTQDLGKGIFNTKDRLKDDNKLTSMMSGRALLPKLGLTTAALPTCASHHSTLPPPQVGLRPFVAFTNRPSFICT